VESLRVLNFGFLAASPAPSSAPAPGARGIAPACPEGGVATTDCEREPGVPGVARSIETTVFDRCRDRDPGTGLLRERSGTLIREVVDDDFCFEVEIPPGTAVNVRMRDFVETLTASDASIVAQTFANTRAYSAIEQSSGCTGRDGFQEILGSITRTCAPGAVEGCTAATSDLTLSGFLDLSRTSREAPCRLETFVNGMLDIDNRATGERSRQSFGLELVERPAGDGRMEIAQRGVVDVDCLGEVRFESTVPMLFGSGDDCPLAGSFEVTLPGSLEEPLRGSSLRQRTRAGSTFASSVPIPRQSVPVAGGYRERAFRAANGEVYQVIQHGGPNAQIGSEEFQLTTIVGSTDAIGACSGSPGENLEAEAVVAAATGRAFLLDRVVRSALLDRAEPPCFNPNSEQGRGRVCVGSGCTLDCACPPPSVDCVTFTAADGVSVGSDSGGVAPLNLADPLSVSGSRCAGFSGGAAYAFGSGSPTTSAPACAAAPAGGLRFPSTPSTLILAFAPPLAVPFAVASAGFAIDTDGANVEGCESGVITGIATNQNKIPPPRFDYTAFSGIAFDFNGDARNDKVLESCLNATLAQCGAPATPTPTPTVGPPPGCAPELLPSEPVVMAIGTTTATANALGGATCGDGGNSAPERVFQYTPPSAGVYVIETEEADFDTLLYLRAGDCEGPELACGDDTFDSQRSLLAVALSQGQTVAIVVDGSAGARGSFTLRVRSTDSDADGFSDEDEARAGSDPSDPDSIPMVSSESALVSYLNGTDARVGNATSGTVSYLNTFRRAPGRAESAPVSYLQRFLSSPVRSAFSAVVSYLQESGAALLNQARRSANYLISGESAPSAGIEWLSSTPTPSPTPTPTSTKGVDR
jgi:hypothetical protein